MEKTVEEKLRIGMLFERATEDAWRFSTSRGDMTVEQLWQMETGADQDVPTDRSGKERFDLVRVVDRLMKDKEGMVSTENPLLKKNAPSKALILINDKIDLVAYIFDVKEARKTEKLLAKAEADKKAEEKAQELRLLKRVQEDKLIEKYKDLPVEEVSQKIQKLQ